MPELPEVETVCLGLNKTILNKKISKYFQNRPDIRFPIPANIASRIEGSNIIQIKRRGKYILIYLNNDEVIIMHLGMSGNIIVHKQPKVKFDKHDHVGWLLDNNSQLVFNDPRRFGLIDISKKSDLFEHKLIKHLGIEPLTDEFTGEFLHNIFKTRSAPVKNVIMNSKLVVGVGNIYACEALFQSGINPTLAANKISKEKCDLLCKNIKEVLGAAIKSGGSSLKDYMDADGNKGYFQHQFKVYGRENEACFNCLKPIKRIIQQGRSTFYCFKCQR